MNNEEPIELSHFPSARAPEPHEIPAIEREDFPAPPFPYAVEGIQYTLYMFLLPLKLYFAQCIIIKLNGNKPCCIVHND